MIEELSIQNVALIDQMRLQFLPGFNALTGETGAGKSVILKSLGLAIGERGSVDLVQEGQSHAQSQIAFNLSEDHDTWDLLSQANQVFDSSEPLIISRQISAGGRSRSDVNGQLMTLTQIKQVSEILIDIHGQHQHQSLFRKETHLNLLDQFANLLNNRSKIETEYNKILQIRRQITSLEQKLEKAKQEKELLEFQVSELDQADLQIEEEETLATQHRLLSNAELLFESTNQIYADLYRGGEAKASALNILKDAVRNLSKIGQMDQKLEQAHKLLESALYEIEDIASQIRDYNQGIEFSPIRLAEVEDRIDQLKRLKRKYGNTIEEVIAFHQSAEQKLEDVDTQSHQLDQLKKQLSVATNQTQKLAEALSVKRQRAAKKLDSLVEKELHTLGMKKAVFKAKWRQVDLNSDGIDEIEFLISTNVGTELKPLTKIASGGEISRVMLAMKTILAQTDQIPTLIFDEIDVGIGGHTANVVGKKLKELSQFCQVICITHLPQIACLADRHFRVDKQVKNKQTVITAYQLTEEDRVSELARMQGDKTAQAAMAYARELLGKR